MSNADFKDQYLWVFSKTFLFAVCCYYICVLDNPFDSRGYLSFTFLFITNHRPGSSKAVILQISRWTHPLVSFLFVASSAVCLGDITGLILNFHLGVQGFIIKAKSCIIGGNYGEMISHINIMMLIGVLLFFCSDLL